jgi:hypothetical protein
MSTTTMLQLVQQVTNELGIGTPASVAGNSNQDVIQILALMNATGYELLRRADWRELTKQHTFYTQATTTTGRGQLLPPPSRFHQRRALTPRIKSWVKVSPMRPM